MLTATQMQSFATVNGSEIYLADKPFYFAGTNAYYLFYADPSDIQAVFKAASKLKSPVIRTWLYADGRKAAYNSQGNDVWFQDVQDGKVIYNDDQSTGLGRFDLVLDMAKQWGVKLMVTLSNNWDNFGGTDFYIDKLAEEKTHGAFYTSSAVKKAYKAWISHVLNRVNMYNGRVYKDDPTIFAVELMNEPRCSGSSKFPSGVCNPGIITSWVAEMAAHVKSIDNKHLLGVGDEGFWNGQVSYPGITYGMNGEYGIDFEANAKLKDIDIIGIHAYMNQWGTPNEPLLTQNTVQWVKDHGILANKINKPLYVGEYGMDDKSKRLQYFSAIQAAMEQSTACTFSWALVDTLYGQRYQDDPVSYNIFPDDPNINRLIVDHAQRMWNKNQ
ncbi:glycoside hydrolase superfamily [Gorgonomyces haynaldii]|nr:glycoside hydrolase superfamily [Gorgonomyces haynaldii]